jgi:hypothetical protein
MPDGSAVLGIKTIVCFSFVRDDLINWIIATVTSAANTRAFVYPACAGRMKFVVQDQ